MLKFLATLVLGVAIGYWLGFADAEKNSDNVAARAVTWVGDWQRDRFTNDIDKQMDSAEASGAAARK